MKILKSIVSFTAVAFPPLTNSDQAISVSIGFHVASKGDVPFQDLAFDYSCADWDDFSEP